MPSKKKQVTGFGAVLLMVLAFAIFAYKNFHTVVVSGHSMDHTLHNGEKLLVSKAYWLVGPIKDKDIVVVTDSNPDGYIIKRVYKMAGETVDWVNEPHSWSLSKGPFVVPKGDIYLLGDNRPVSDDSRFFGPVPLTHVLGKVIIIR